MPWIAFVPDISGVCSSVGTFEITSMPRKIASTRIVTSKTRSRSVAHAVDLLLAGDACAARDLVRPVERRARPRARGGGAAPGRCASRASTRGTASSSGGSSAPTSVTPSRSTISPGSVSSQLPPVSAARSTITEPGRIASTADAGMIFGAGAAGDGGGRDDDVEVARSAPRAPAAAPAISSAVSSRA